MSFINLFAASKLVKNHHIANKQQEIAMLCDKKAPKFAYFKF